MERAEPSVGIQEATAVAIDQQAGEPRKEAERRGSLLERQRLPHGTAERLAAQLDIFSDSRESAA
jgi:hypothetical protein